MTKFSPWNNYAVPNGLWLMGDFAGNQRQGIAHVVDHSDYVNVWSSRGDGTFDVKSFSPWAGYAMPNGFWLTANLTAVSQGDGQIVVTWKPIAADLTYNVQISSDDGATWQTVVANKPGRETTLDAGQFDPAAGLRVRVAAT